MRRRKLAAGLAAVLMIGLPLAALRLAPSARADDSPGANLAGVNATADATGLEVAPLTPGLLPVGNVTLGNVFEAAIPYVTTSASTGPSSTGLASPAYPGDAASQAGNLIDTFNPIPASLVNLLNYPALARSNYPAQVSAGTSGSYTPPTGSAAGVLTASSRSAPSGTTAQAALSQTTLPSSLISIGTTTATASTVLGASSVQSVAHTVIGRVSLLGGAVVISGLESDASATSDGATGQQTSDLKIGHVTVAGLAAYIGPDGIHLAGSAQDGALVPALNQVLGALAQAGISVKTVAPTSHTDGASAQVTSGALQISFLDQHIPNPNGILPVSAIGLDLNIGVAEAAANATSLPPFDSSGGSGSGLPSGGSDTGSGAGLVGGSSVGVGATGSTGPDVGAGTAGAVASGPVLAGPGSTSSGTGNGGAAAPAPNFQPQPASVLGAPVKLAWVVLAFLISLVVAGPLLAYANWQLLRGRRS